MFPEDLTCHLWPSCQASIYFKLLMSKRINLKRQILHDDHSFLFKLIWVITFFSRYTCSSSSLHEMKLLLITLFFLYYYILVHTFGHSWEAITSSYVTLSIQITVIIAALCVHFFLYNEQEFWHNKNHDLRFRDLQLTLVYLIHMKDFHCVN